MIAMKRIDRWLSRSQDRQFNIVIGGRIFGGRYGESPQVPKSVEKTDDTLVLRFNTTEKLIIEKPKCVLSLFGNLYVLFAAKVIWGWHSYGREETPENWAEEMYVREGFAIKVRRTGPAKEIAAEVESWRRSSLSFVAISRII